MSIPAYNEGSDGTSATHREGSATVAQRALKLNSKHQQIPRGVPPPPALFGRVPPDGTSDNQCTLNTGHGYEQRITDHMNAITGRENSRQVML